MDTDTLENYIIEDTLSIQKLVQNYSRYIYIIVKNMTKELLTEEDIEEIVSDVLLIVWKNREIIKKDLPLKPYIAGVTKNLTKNKLRKHKLNNDEIDENIKSDENIEEILECKEQMEIIENVLSSFGNDSQIFILFYFQGMKSKEIGEKLSLTESNVNVKLHRIKDKMKKALRKRGYTYGA